ncbi:MAG: hypothetical protein ACOZAA_05065 [Pseudomonadota bacterium]
MTTTEILAQGPDCFSVSGAIALCAFPRHIATPFSVDLTTALGWTRRAASAGAAARLRAIRANAKRDMGNPFSWRLIVARRRAIFNIS